MSSFDEFYKKWKEKNGVTTESGYKNLSNEQKIESANSIVNNFLQNYQNTFNNNTVKNSTNEVYKNKKTSLWDDVKNIASGLGKTGQNIWYGLQNGIKNTQQTIGRAFVNSQANMTDWSNKMNEEMLKSRMNKYPDETNEITKILNNPIISGEQLRKEGEATSNKIQKEKDENSKKIQDNINSIDNTILKKTAELAPSIGQMIPGFLPGGAVYMTGSATGNYYDDAKQRGMSDNEAITYSGIMGLMEGATEMIGIGNLSKAGKGVKALITGAGKEGVKKALKEGAEQITKTSLKSVLKDYGIGIADNVIQEAIIDPIQELTAQTVAGKDKAQWEGIGQKMLQDGINGGLVSAILGGANLGIQSCTGVIQKMNNNQEVAQQELRTAVQDASKQLDVGQMITDSTQQQINKYKDYYQGENLDNNTQNMLNQSQNIINNYNTQNSQQNTIQNQINKQTQQIVLAQNKNGLNLNITTNSLKDNAINEINNSKISEISKKEMLDVLNNIDNITENDLNAIKQSINEVNRTELETNTTYKDSLARKRNYIKYKDDTNTYDSKAVNEVLDIIPSNKNGNRTVKQWLKVADELGKRISEKSNSEIEQIAYKSWFDAQPTKNITKYDNLNKTNVGFQKLTSDDWINTINNAVLQQREQTIQQQNKTSQSGKLEQTNNITAPIIEKQTKPTIKDFNESAKQYNIDYSNEDLQEINQMFEKREIKAYFDENTFKNNNNAFSVWKPITDEQGNILGREVVFNPKAKDSKVRVQELAIHELGHDLDLNEVQNMILKDASRKLNWESARKSLENTYREAYKNDGINISEEKFKQIVDEEATMSILQRELGSQEYVNRLVNQNQSIAKKIYNWVIDKLNKFTGGKNEKIFWADIKNKFETAYNQEFNKNDDITKFSIAGKKSLENMKDNSSLYNRGMNSYNNAMNLAKQNIDNEQIRRMTGWFQDKNGDWKYEFSDKDMELKNIKLQKDKTYRLGDILEHDTLFTLYPELKNLEVQIKDMNKIGGNYNKNSKSITLSSNSLKSNKTTESTLIHEIQHAIQDIEGHELGTTSKLSKKNYYESLGEIEADNTRTRFINEKYNNKDMSKSVPESSKSNPKHRLYDNYMNNRNNIDKIKDSVFKYFKRLGDSNEFYQETNQKTTQQNLRLVDDGGNGRYVETENNSDSFNLATKEWQQFLDNNYKKQGTGKNLKEYSLPTKKDIKPKTKFPIKENIVAEQVENSQKGLPTKQDIKQTSTKNKVSANLPLSEDTKARKHYKSIIESDNTTKEAKAIAKELMGTDTYVPETNKGQLLEADNRIKSSSPEAELKSLMSRAMQGEKITPVDIAVGDRLIEYYSKIGDKNSLQEAIQAKAMAGTSAGQTVQAFAMLNHQTPQGQATWIQRSVDKMNNELAKKKGGTITKDEDGNVKVINKNGKDITDKVDLFNLTPDMTEKIVNSKSKQEMYDNIDQVYEELGQQVPKSTIEKIDSWRYFSMLANPKTHIRNIVGNVAMGKTQRLKDKLAGGIEDILSTFNKDMERTKTLRLADEKTKEFAKNDVLNPDVQTMMELNENKYNPQARLQNARRTFKSDAMENTLGRLFDWNDNLLEAEDALGLKSAYKKALTDYLTANKIDVDNITDKQLSKARNYAVEQAKEATFHQANSIATAINQFSKKNGLTKGAMDAVLPFVKTPMNVAKAGMEYNPAGLLKTITYDTVKLRKDDITVNKYIDNLSKGLTGTGIAVLGYVLADAGILKASGGEDDKKEKYDEALGNQAYSITIGDKTYSLDWLAPVGIPLFVGAEAKALKDLQREEKSSISSDDDKKFNQAVSSLENIANAMANSMSPMSEMSMISGLTSALKSYEQDSTKMLGTMGTNAVKSYINQFVPTLLGQIARTTDDYERSTTSTKNGVLSKAIDQTKLQVMSKVPGLRQKLPTKTDIWGNEQKSNLNLPVRAFNNFINPATVKNVNTSKVDEEINNLYNRTGETKLLPSTIDKNYTINGQIYRMTNEEYAKYKKDYGQTSYKLLDSLVKSKEYNKLSDEQKQKAIENVYSYAKEKNKVDYATKNKQNVETSTLYNTLEDLKKNGGEQSEYLSYLSKITEVKKDKEKNQILANSNYTDKTKSIIYANTTGKEDDIYNSILYKDNVNIDEYLNYKIQEFESDKEDNGTIEGKSISGSKKEKMYNYVNDMNITENQKIAILGKQYKLKRQEQTKLYNYINNLKGQTKDEKLEIFKKYSKNFTIYKDNTMNFK